MTNPWQPGTTYVPGAIVRPTGVIAPVASTPTNADFSGGDTGWAKETGWSITAGGGFSGVGFAQLTIEDAVGIGRKMVNQDFKPIAPGTTVTASAMVLQGDDDSGHGGAGVALGFYDADSNRVGGQIVGNVVSSSHGGWQRSSVSGTCPQGAVFIAAEFAGFNEQGHPVSVSSFSWDYVYTGPPTGLVYKAVQADPGKSASVEPNWPPVLGETVIDNEVTWEAVIATQLVWKAVPISKSGNTEPTWPLGVGGQVMDGTANWTTTTPMVPDTRCPHSKQVAIAQGKVFAGDQDITRYCVTYNPLDWTLTNDAGFIPHGIQSVQEVNCTCLSVYRGNLAIFTASSLQLWKTDPDPAAIVILDQVESVGTTYERGAIPVAQDVYFIADKGIRSISVSAAQQAMGAGDIGNPVDPVVIDLIGPDVYPLAAFFPNLGQSLFFLGDQCLVLTSSPINKLTSWSLYQLPITVTDVGTLDGDVYVRDDAAIYWMNPDARADYSGTWDVIIEWQYLDLGTPNALKAWTGVALESDASGSMSMAYKIQQPALRTVEKKVLQDGGNAFLSFSLISPAVAPRLTFRSDQMTSFTTATLFFEPTGGTPGNVD